MSALAPFEIDVHQVKSLLDDGQDVLLLDCREQDEWSRCRIPGAVWIPMGTIPARMEEIEPFRSGTIVVCCHLGGRSAQVTAWLRQQGFARARNMTGGIDRWAECIDRSMARY